MKLFSFQNTVKRILIIAIIVSTSSLIGFSLGKRSGSVALTHSVTDDPVTAESTLPNLQLHVTADKNAGLTTIPAEQLGGNNCQISYLGISNVTIDLKGKAWNLEDAIREGYTSIDQMISCARLDASVGFCKEIPKSKNGLTKFTYRYPEFDLLYINDLYETPDGEQHLISEFGICESGRTLSFLYMNDETGKPIDYEDWGLNFAVSEVHPTGITIKCTQSGGQQVGNLMVRNYILYKKNRDTDAEEFMEPLVDEFQGESNLNIAVKRESTTEISIDFSHLYGELSAGSYVLYLVVDDQYNRDELHPFMRKFHDEQLCGVAFAIK